MPDKNRWSWMSFDRRAAASAGALALLYVVISTVYIGTSGYLATHFARDAEQLQRIETMKGTAFVMVTGLLLFALCFVWRKRLQRQEKLLVRNECRAVAGMCSASVAHDLRNLLMALDGLIEGLRDQKRDESFLSALGDELEQSVRKLSRLSHSLVRSAQEVDATKNEKVDVRELLQTAITLLQKHPDARNCDLVLNSPPDVSLVVNVPLFEQAILNLIVNAAQATGGGGRVEIVVEEENDEILLEIHDSGPGIPEKEADVVFEPGYTTKESGTGLGLLCVRAFAASCNGRIILNRSRLGGAAVGIGIPLFPLPDSGEVTEKSDAEEPACT